VSMRLATGDSSGNGRRPESRPFFEGGYGRHCLAGETEKGAEGGRGTSAEGTGLSAKEIKRHGLAVGVKKMLAIELMCQLSSTTQREVGRQCGYRHESTVGRERRTLLSGSAGMRRCRAGMRRASGTWNDG